MNKNSLEAYRKLGHFANKHYTIIYSVMQHLIAPNRFQISRCCDLTPEQVGKRLMEMRRIGLIKYVETVLGRSNYRIRLENEPFDVIEKRVSKDVAEKECVKLYDRVQQLEKENKILKEKAIDLLKFNSEEYLNRHFSHESVLKAFLQKRRNCKSYSRAV